MYYHDTCQKSICSSTNETVFHKRLYNVRDYLTREILEILNQATREEQEFFGYEALKVEDLM